MDQSTFRILKKLCDDIGRDYSINSLTSELNKEYHKAYYKNIFDKIKGLSIENHLILKRIGKSSVISINYGDYGVFSLLAEMELLKQRELLKDDEELKLLIYELSALFRQNFYYINSVSIIRPKENKALNRQEFLFILKDAKDEGIREETYRIHKLMRNLEDTHNIKLDCLILRENELTALLNESAHNPLNEMLSGQTVLMHQMDYWLLIKRMMDKGIAVRSAEEINPAKIGEKDLVYNLARFGYKELGAEIIKGKDYCIETIITSLFLSGDARRIEAIPVILEKNLEGKRKPIFSLLIFLSLKYGKAEKLLAYLDYLRNQTKNKEVAGATELMKSIGIKPEIIDLKAAKQKTELYHGNQKR